MKNIAFIDIEVKPETRKILDMGGIRENGRQFHSRDFSDLLGFLNGAHFIGGHNILQHDWTYIGEVATAAGIDLTRAIDTLYLSPLLFPLKPYHHLLKDDKLQSEHLNNPLNDSIKARDLFFDEVAAFSEKDDALKQILFSLLHDKKEFTAFFQYIGYSPPKANLEELILKTFQHDICANANIEKIIAENPVELAYALSLIYAQDRKSITPPWVLKQFPDVETVLYLLRNKPCLPGCRFCNQALDVRAGLKRYFNYDSFRTFNGEPLQERAARAAIENKSILAIFPTGGGKSITFQVPALMSGETVKGLTVVISPLQSLMKDQVDNLEKHGITEAVTINGLLDPIERSKSIERVQDGSASLLYISPESLRSKTIESLLLGRKVVRFVIDEAHCFSSWGHDFRVDYLYIGDFIKNFQHKKNASAPIPVSCFTATAKQKVIEDIRAYFREKLSFELELFESKASRTNLRYRVFQKGDEEEKYNAVRNLLEGNNCPSIIYVSRTHKAFQLAERLSKDGFQAKPYHGKMDVKDKTKNQDAFIRGEVQVMVATSAFGMGVDKKDVGMVIHYEISDSLENYVQEAGRAGRDENITADCYILFNEEDLDKHFILLNQTKLGLKEIQQVWKAIKELTKYRSTLSNSALEIARKAGWDENIRELETRVTTAIAALETQKYLRRGQNAPRVYANSILTKTAQEAIDKIDASPRFEEREKEYGKRIIKKLIAGKARKQASDETAETRIDYIADHLGMKKKDVINVVNLLREENILADAQDLTAFIRQGENKNRSAAIARAYGKLEEFLLDEIEEEEKIYSLKKLNEGAEKHGCEEAGVGKIKTIFNFWAIKGWIKRRNPDYSNTHVAIQCNHPKEKLKASFGKRWRLARFIVDFLFERSRSQPAEGEEGKKEILVEFSILELKEAFEKNAGLFEDKCTIEDVENALFYLSRIEAIKIEGGFLIVYNRLEIERLELDNRKSFKKEDYQALEQFYDNKAEQIHIVGAYAEKMIEDYRSALQFVDDYFQLNQSSFLSKYFDSARQKEIRRTLTPSKFRQLFGELSPAQLGIVKDNESKYIVVAAGPGTGKTKVLVHKLASLLLMEDVRHEQLLMLTFSRAAATEFKKRLIGLIGNAALFVTIKTFHSFCFDILEKVGSLEQTEQVIGKAIEKIKNGEAAPGLISKAVLVIDEAQDMSEDEYALVTALMEQNEDMRVIAIGDDDQNVFAFRKASSKFMADLKDKEKAKMYELTENFRSRSNIVDFSNQFASRISERLKKTPLTAHQAGNGKIKIVRYQSRNLIKPLVGDIMRAGLSGATGVLVKTNEEALLVTGLLVKNKMPARLIQTNEGFSLCNLLEIRHFLEWAGMNQSEAVVIHEEIWERAKKKLAETFGASPNLEICKNLINQFEVVAPKTKYKTDLEEFVKESRLEDFYTAHPGETILVSTIHKAKGREFDNVFLLLENFSIGDDDKKRQLFVGMTRAKQNLSIHLNGSYLDAIAVEGLEREIDTAEYAAQDEVVLHLTHKDVVLDKFIHWKEPVSQLRSGDELILDGDGKTCRDARGRPVLRFSGAFISRIEDLRAKGYAMKAAKVNFIVYWVKQETGEEARVVLAEVRFGLMA
jgi:ATP-dependent DNA helicase RecQ